MEDCVQVDAGFPVRQGDVLKRISGTGQARLAIVVTADCDIENFKFGDAGLACVQLTPLADYMLSEHAEAAIRRALKKKFKSVTEWINKRWMQKNSQNNPLSQDVVENWILSTSFDEIENALEVIPAERGKYLKNESLALRSAQGLMKSPIDKYSIVDALRALQSKKTSRAEQLKIMFGSLDPRELPLDMFYVSSVPGEPGLGFIAKLRALSFVPFDRTFTSMILAKEVDESYVRVGRLESTFRYALAQQFGMLFSRIGMPTKYQNERDEVFSLVAAQMISDMEKVQ